MRNVVVAAVQMKCSKVVEENINKAEELIRKAAKKGANIILLPELFERQYFCQEKRFIEKLIFQMTTFIKKNFTSLQEILDLKYLRLDLQILV